MFWADRLTKVGGVALLFLAAAVIVDVVLDIAVLGESNPLQRGDVEAMLEDINDNETLFIAGNAFGVVADSIATLAVAAIFYLLFRDRSRLLALITLIGLVVASGAFLVADATGITIGFLAADYVEEGGPGGIAAGDSFTLQAARAVAVSSAMADLAGLTVLSLGLISLGLLVAWAPDGEVNPPRWLGGLLIASALALLLSWFGVAAEDAGILIVLGIIGTLLFLIILGGWLLFQPERQPEWGQARPAPA